nr:hypothetical protein [uncultured Marinobacter sp.]
MPKGAKKGENRFKGSQTKRQNFRLERIESHVIPRLKTLAGRTTFDGKTPFCMVCADIFNEDLPVNERKIGYRTFEQNSAYWSKVGTLYFQHWESDDELKPHQERVMNTLTTIESSRVKEENRRLKEENEALRAALRAHGAEERPHELPFSNEDSAEKAADFDRVCRALDIVIEASDEIFEVHEDEMKITSNLFDLGPAEGLVPTALAAPFINWRKERREKTGGRS